MLLHDSECSARRGEILLVEDSAKDARLICEVLQEQGHQHDDFVELMQRTLQFWLHCSVAAPQQST